MKSRLVRIDDVCEIRGGGTPSKAVARFWTGDVPWVSPKDMKSQIVNDSIDHITTEAIHNSTTSLIPEGAILVVVRSGILARTIPVAITGRPVAINQDIKALCPTPAVDSRYLYHLLTAREPELLALVSRGATVHRLLSDLLRGIQFELPPLAEQKQIVAILDEAFAAIDAAITNTQSNLANVRELFRRQLDALFATKGDGWTEEPLANIIESNDIGLMRNSREQSGDRAYPYVKMNNITRDNRFDSSVFVTVDATEEEVERFQLRRGDFLFNTRNSVELVGKSCIYDGPDDANVLYNNNIMRIRFRADIDSRFVLFAFGSAEVKDRLDALKSGTTNVAAIYYKDLQALTVPVAPPRLQRQTVTTLTNLQASTQALECLYTRKLTILAELKQSILHKAFTGALTATAEVEAAV